MSVDLSGTRERMIPDPNTIATAPQPTRIILVPVDQTFSGVAQNGMALANQRLLQDVNPANVTGNPNGYWATYLHLFITMGTRYLYDMTDGQVYDLLAYDTNTLVVVWPKSW